MKTNQLPQQRGVKNEPKKTKVTFGVDTTTEPGDKVVRITSGSKGGSREGLLLVVKTPHPHSCEHPRPQEHLTALSLDNIMDGDETLTWVEQQVVASTAECDRRMDVGERWELEQDGGSLTLESPNLKQTQEAIEINEETIMPI